jgi:hypothetical protein
MQTSESAHGQTISPPEVQSTECSGLPVPKDARIPVAATALGVLVAIACAGLLPSGGTLPILIASLLAGLSIVPVTASLLTGWMLPLLSLAGGASVALTMRRRDGAARE